VSWVGLRGAVSIFLAAIPTLSAVPNADMYFDVAYVVVLASLLVQGWTIPWFAKKLKVALSETAPDVQRLEVDIPGQHNVELVGYPIVAESPIMLRSRQPDWLQTVCVIRNGRVVSGEDGRKFRPGDYGYFLVPIESVRRLDRLFAPSEAIHVHQPVESFSFSGELQLADIATAYGLPVPEGLENVSIRDAFMMAQGDETSLGDRLQLGPAALVVAEMDGDQVKTVTFEIDQEAAGPSAEARDRFNRGIGKIADRTAKRFSGLFSRHQ
jgi:cell volume regulation protein A